MGRMSTGPIVTDDAGLGLPDLGPTDLYGCTNRMDRGYRQTIPSCALIAAITGKSRANSITTASPRNPT